MIRSEYPTPYRAEQTGTRIFRLPRTHNSPQK
nr:MAG TPA: hypothetical protein [Caudoviricetes sp.]